LKGETSSLPGGGVITLNRMKKKRRVNMKKGILITGVIILLFSCSDLSGIDNYPENSAFGQTISGSSQGGSQSKQVNTKPQQQVSKSKPAAVKSKPTGPAPAGAKSKPAPAAKSLPPGAVRIGTQIWAVSNLNVVTFRNGDTIPEAKSNEEWVKAGEAGKPAWCYYSNNPAGGKKYGRLYNWYAVNDPRGLAPVGWSVPGEADWKALAVNLGGAGPAGNKMKSTGGWQDGSNGTNESGFAGLPGGYRVENGNFMNVGSIGIWWSASESNALNAVNFYLSQGGSLSVSSNPKQRGESVRCIKK
jgi:uncharacterized protein (TIGR02145 family)